MILTSPIHRRTLARMHQIPQLIHLILATTYYCAGATGEKDNLCSIFEIRKMESRRVYIVTMS